MEQWLESQGATRRAQDDFWSVILVSALAERLDRISLADGRKVLVEGFMANTSGYELQIPTVPLGKIYQEHLVQWLANRAAICQLATPVRRIILDKSAVQAVELDNGSQRRFDGYVLAIPWRPSPRSPTSSWDFQKYMYEPEMLERYGLIYYAIGRGRNQFHSAL